MELHWTNLVRDWHDDLLAFTRHHGPRLFVVLVLAFVLIRVLSILTRKLADFSRRAPGHHAGRAQQISTLVGVIRSIGVFAILFVTAMQVLPILGIHIEALLASAGVAGLAIGFGAQTLVKDVINGFFILVEDQFEVGETIRTGGVQGTVEEITMRRTALRDADGTLHIVPNGSIQIVSNMTRDWSQVTLRVAADYAEESDRVIQTLGEVADEFYKDPAFHGQMVAQPEVPGIERISGHEVDYVMLVKVRPGRQDNVARELRRRIKAAFERNNIKAGFPAQVYIGELPTTKT